MKRAKKLAKKLRGRIADWENMVNKTPEAKKAYRKPGSNK